ncbi:hypothetical protein Cal7507_1991 [Calothrix sp. PCC 7507]|nr:hypothetical protein Cal7507_1991 [Calothrix sp. PCC 7507]
MNEKSLLIEKKDVQKNLKCTCQFLYLAGLTLRSFNLCGVGLENQV